MLFNCFFFYTSLYVWNYKCVIVKTIVLNDTKYLFVILSAFWDFGGMWQVVLLVDIMHNRIKYFLRIYI